MKLPPTAFAYYLALGPGRSYQKVAARFGVSKQAVAKRARKETWQDEVTRLDALARQKATQEAVEGLAEMDERHRKSLQIIQKMAIEALRARGALSVKDAMRALVMAVKGERDVRDEPRPVRIVIGGANGDRVG